MTPAEIHRIGHDQLGPIFANWARLLLRTARRRGVSRLFFVARDGDFLNAVAARMLEAQGCKDSLERSVLRLSRRVCHLAAHPAIDDNSIVDAFSIRAGNPRLVGLLRQHGLSDRSASAAMHAANLAANTRLGSLRQARSLLDNAPLREVVRSESERCRAALLAFLDQSGAFGGNAALVDIGWRGSSQRNLEAALLPVGPARLPGWLYLALWRDDGRRDELPENSEGLLGDLRRDRSLAEGAPWYSAFLLEAICRANEPTLENVEDRGGKIITELASEMTASREAERTCWNVVAALRTGILDHVGVAAIDATADALTDADLRSQAQHKLLRLGFEPTREEIAIGRALVHTESHDPEWSSPLVLPGNRSPWSSPRQWFAGLASPWRGAYVMDTGGQRAAKIYRTFESALLALPPWVRGTLRDVAVRFAGV